MPIKSTLKPRRTKLDLSNISTLKAIAESNRLYILNILRKGEICVCEIEEALDIPQSLISHHLKVLKKSGLIRSKRDGVRIVYSLNSRKVCELLKVIEKINDK